MIFTVIGFLSRNRVELHAVALEFSLHHFRHFHALAFQFDIGITCDRVIVDGQQNVARREALRGRAGLNHRAHQHTAIVILQTEKRRCAGFCSFE